MAGFDVDGARQAGYSEGEIADFLARENSFDAGAARQSGYSDADIIQHLSAQQQGSAPERPGFLSRAGRFVDNTVRQVAQGATLGYMDELSAGLRTGAGLWGDYGAALSEERSRDREFRQESPVTATVANIAGGVASPVARIFAPGASASLPGAMLRGAGAGAAAGGVTGFGEGEGGFSERLGSAGVGAALGGAVGGAVPALVEGGRAVAGAIGRRTGVGSGSADAERIILRDLQRDGVAPDELLRRTQDSAAAGRPEVIADLAGENVRGTAAAVARAPGRGRQAASDLVGGRGGNAQRARLGAEVQRHISADDFRATADDLIAQRARASAPAYEAAFERSGPVDVEGILSGIDDRLRVARGPVRSALERVRTYLTVEGPGGGGRMADTNIRGLHEAKLAIDDMLSGGSETPIGRVARRELAQIQRSLVRAMDDASTVDGRSLYGAARAAFAGPSALLDAMDTGARLLRGSQETFDDVTAASIRSMSPSEREALRTGVARGLLNRIDGAADNAELTRLRQVFGSQAVRDRLRATFDSEADYSAFARALDAEARMAATNRAVAPNAGSQTAPLQERMADLRTPPSGSPIVDPGRQAASGSLLPDLVQVGRSGGLSAPAFRMVQRLQEGAQQSRLERNMDTLAPMLFGPDPQSREQVARALMARALSDQRTQQVINPRIRAIARGLSIGGAIEAND